MVKERDSSPVTDILQDRVEIFSHDSLTFPVYARNGESVTLFLHTSMVFWRGDNSDIWPETFFKSTLTLSNLSAFLAYFMIVYHKKNWFLEVTLFMNIYENKRNEEKPWFLAGLFGRMSSMRKFKKNEFDYEVFHLYVQFN